jgi:hypothetical protein
MKPSAQTSLAAAAASAACRAAPGLSANGFSHRTCLPAASAATVHSVCIELGKAM